MPPKIDTSECKCNKGGERVGKIGQTNKTGKIRKPPLHKPGRKTLSDMFDNIAQVYQFFMGGILDANSTTKLYKVFFSILDDCVECLIYAINQCQDLLEIIRKKPETDDLRDYDLIWETFRLFIHLHDIFERGLKARNAVYLKRGKKVKEKVLPKLEVPKDAQEKIVKEMKQGGPECLRRARRAINRLNNPIRASQNPGNGSIQVDVHMNAIPGSNLSYDPNIPPPPPPDFDIPPPPPPDGFEFRSTAPPPPPMNSHEVTQKRIFDRIKELEHRVKTGADPGEKVIVPCQLHCAPGRYCKSCRAHSKTPEPQQSRAPSKTPEPQRS